ncbi:hypothetical protein V5R04_09120 [Jonesiaceae bacterium BS-20]|uniref:DUF4209 domain-containing protein n=1 Tax=Jonesiaceae bacterium BS-20 TaxID=3120821 RepID=A0AAU7DRG7_9MICO
MNNSNDQAVNRAVLVDEFSPEEVDRVVRQMELISAEPSRYRRLIAAREIFSHYDLPQDDPTHATPEVEDSLGSSDCPWEEDLASSLQVLEEAAFMAVRYSVEFKIVKSQERIRLEPNFKGPDSSDPVDTDQVKTSTVTAWIALAEKVQSPFFKALLSHLAFQSQAKDAHIHARIAVSSYLTAARAETRAADKVYLLRTAIHLARSIKNQSMSKSAMEDLEILAESLLTSKRKSVGAAREALTTLVSLHSPRALDLAKQASLLWGETPVGGVFWELWLTADTGRNNHDQIWHQRISTVIKAAESSTSNQVRATRLADALALAEQSGLPELREQVSVMLQGVRKLDLEYMNIRASSYQFEEQFEEMVAALLLDPIIADYVHDFPLQCSEQTTHENKDSSFPPWYLRLNALASSTAPLGDFEKNRKIVEAQNNLAPLTALFPISLQTSEGLPLYTPKTEEERFDLDLVAWEIQLLDQWAPVLFEALHRTIDNSIPSLEELSQVLSFDGKTTTISAQLTGSFLRFWSGDSSGALHTALPMVEALVREAVLRADRGIFRLQKNQVPGQYVGLGVLLELFFESYNVGENDQRFLKSIYKHPGGWNLRNQLFHGYLPNIHGSKVAGVVLYSILRILVLSAVSAEDTSDQSEASKSEA